MSAFLEKIGLQESFTCTLEIEKERFVAQFKKQVDQGDLGFLFDTIDVFSSSKNEYKGHVSTTGFKIRKKRKLFTNNGNQATASGIFVQQDQHLVIQTIISAVNYSLFVMIIVTIGFSFLLFTGPFEKLLLLFPLFPFAVYYFITRRTIKNFKRELEREFYYLTKN